MIDLNVGNAMDFNTTAVDTSILPTAFWKSIEILLDKPHVINKRLWGCKSLFKICGRPLSANWKLPFNCTTLYYDQVNIQEYEISIIKEFELEQSNNSPANPENMVQIILLELFPKLYSENHAFQLVCLQKNVNTATFYNVTGNQANHTLCPDFPYTLQLASNQVILRCMCDKSSKSLNWLVNIFLPQFLKWGEGLTKEAGKKHISVESLCLVSKEKYYNKYNDLKLKYGKEMVKIWPECTDPTKFVYEDVAIATYLLLLWEDSSEQNSRKTFVDLGCGNGLLVYILTKEGHKGVGIDVRKRQIWELYSEDVKLEEKTIVPSDANLFPDTDWIIGNHSDELTPWIPVIAARSSYTCNFFLLPCCAYNFNGTKYQRKDSSKSQYMEYLEYIQNLCETCGFKTDTDRLKIPSTKRICLIGRGRTHDHQEYGIYCNRIKHLINQEISSPTLQSEVSWLSDFKPREQVEKVRNCTQIDKSIIETIVNHITNYLLEDINLQTNWSPGRSVDINELVVLLTQDKLKALKSECGGLQTLLKNNNHIFKVQSGKVQLRYPRTVDEVKNITTRNKLSTIQVQQKPCWFYNKHPQGCPLSDSNCSFLHKKENTSTV